MLDRVAPYDAGKSLEALARELGIDTVLRLSANENPIGPSPRVIEAIRREAPRAHLYPDGGCTEVRQGLAARLGISADSIVVGNGADELLAMLARAAFDPGDEVVVPHPAFEPYGTEATLSGATVVSSPLRGYEQDLDDMLARVTPRTKCVILCTPHNPTATIIRRGHLERFLGALGDDPPLVLLDEAYRDFCDDPDTPDGIVLQRRFPTVISLRTFSKIAGLAGMRIGYTIARPEHIERLDRVRAPYNVNRLAQAAAVAALADPEHLERTRALVLAERPRLQAALAQRGAPSPPSQANFILPKVGEQAGAVRAALLKAGILVRDGAGVGFPGHLRIAVGTAEQNRRLLEVWDAAVGRPTG
ncbi:MAG TPA: histidinol-phosphate transaminase [Methylomirabilota bacterium]|nr:histidinol-phosphate transaminase [Methylomirabilota bacterium]